MRLFIISLLFVFSFNLSNSQEDNYKGLLTDFIKAQGQFETLQASMQWGMELSTKLQKYMK